MICFGIGSNLGNRLQNLRDAVEKLKTIGKIIKKSNVYESEPWGGVVQPNYLNACLSMEIYDSAENILKLIKNFERELGRVENVRWGARKIDIDILLMDNSIIKLPGLKIPHENLHNRDFVLVPLNEILPDWIHPEINIKISDLAKKFYGSMTRITEL